MAFAGRPSGDRAARSFTIRRGRRGPQKEHALAVLVPRLSVAATASVIDPSVVFGRDAPLLIDIGFGAGHTTLALAELRPEANVLGIETHENGLAMLAHELEQRVITNVRLVCADAFDVIDVMIPRQRAQIVQLVCPDPWPKINQSHRRLFNADFARMLAERLVVGGELRLATDWEPYAEQMAAIIDREPLLENVYDRFAPPHPERPVTTYERKGLAAGRSMRDLLARRI
jgi:tRNA (guanine-N7-)-methyltransferase